MSPRFRLVLAAAILLGLAALFFLPRPTPPPTASASTSAPADRAPAPTAATAPATPKIENRKSEIEIPSSAVAGSPIADDLNAPGGSLRRDLEILNELFGAFQTNFPRLGNPVGENVEITAALAGANPAQFVFISPRHRAINARGELCDRWGTPFRFHQVSGTHMEIRSAGPDRKFATADDAQFP
jgi:hypothetical protein